MPSTPDLAAIVPLIRSKSPEAIPAAFGLWIGYPLWASVIESSPKWNDDERHSRRMRLDSAHRAATDVLMIEAEREGLNSAALLEAHRACILLFARLRGQTPSANSYGLDWFIHPTAPEDLWPGCLGEWRYSLPVSMQEMIRAGEEVIARLATRFDLNHETIPQIVVAAATGNPPPTSLEFRPGAVKLGDAEVPLIGKPFEVLRYLHDCRDRRATLREIMKTVWGQDLIDEQTVRAHICTARDALRKLLRRRTFDPIPCVDRGTGVTAFQVRLS